MLCWTALYLGFVLATRCNATTFKVADSSDIIGADAVFTSHYEDSLLDLARRFSLGYDEIIRANPTVDMWLPGEGKQIALTGQRILPPGPREGIVVNLPEHRLYYFPPTRKGGEKVVMTYPVSIGKLGRGTPLGQTFVTAKIKHPWWFPPESIRKEHAANGDPIPAGVPPGPDNPLGDYKIRLGLGDGTYEIHGTNNPTAVGLAITHGCVRMYPEDVAELFKLISINTPVRFINVPVKVAWANGALLLEAHPPVDAQGNTLEPDLNQFSDLLKQAVGNSTIAINWDYASEVLQKAVGVIATVGLEANDPSVSIDPLVSH
jgi:L,D-transpeptidase ErfK/SrfK